MSLDTCNSPINSLSWWENYFENFWDTYSGREQTQKFMELLTENLPESEREFLASHDASVLDWGCAFGQGVKVLAQTFPRCQVVGLDFASRAIEEARKIYPQYEFLRTENGEIEREFDVIITSNCLEHFDNPLEIMQEHLKSCKRFYVILVPYMEAPFCESHKSQFRHECFPLRLLGFTRICSKVVDVNQPIWRGKQILVIYASASYLHERIDPTLRLMEKSKWNEYYASLPLPEFYGYSGGVADELANRVGELLPSGGKVMEIGCGSGEQSMALAKKGAFSVTLADFSEQILASAQNLFATHKLSAKFELCRDFSSVTADHDLVFNIGILERYTSAERVAFLRRMSDRSRKYVLALVPNYNCYWHWILHEHRLANKFWPYNNGVPLIDLPQTFEKAGLHFLGQTYLGSKEIEFIVDNTTDLDEDVRDILLRIHRLKNIEDIHKSFLVAALGAVTPECQDMPPGWSASDATIDRDVCNMAAVVSDALARCISAETRQSKLDKILSEQNKEALLLKEQLADARKELQSLQVALASITRSRGWRMVLFIRKIRDWVAAAPATIGVVRPNSATYTVSKD